MSGASLTTLTPEPVRLSSGPKPSATSASERVRQTLAQVSKPASVQHLRKLCGMRTATVCSALAELSQRGLVSRDGRGYQLTVPSDSQDVSLSRPIDPQGNGNGKHPPEDD